MSTVKTLHDMRGRWVLITGAVGHLGRTISETLSELGANLILVDRYESDLLERKSEIEKLYPIECRIVECDLCSKESRLELIQAVRHSCSNLSCLINNAAFVGTTDLPGWNAPISEQSSEVWGQVFEVNLVSIFHLCQALMPLLEKGEGANVINVASIYGELGPDWSIYEQTEMSNPAGYAASKGGVIQLTRWLATSYAPRIRVNAISPGGIFRHQPKAFVQQYANRTPLCRMATESDFKGAFAFLASDASEYMTGQVLTIDGGWSAW